MGYQLKQAHKAPKTIRLVNGLEFISKVLDRWTYENGLLQTRETHG